MLLMRCCIACFSRSRLADIASSSFDIVSNWSTAAWRVVPWLLATSTNIRYWGSLHLLSSCWEYWLICIRVFCIIDAHCLSCMANCRTSDGVTLISIVFAILLIFWRLIKEKPNRLDLFTLKSELRSSFNLLASHTGVRFLIVSLTQASCNKKQSFMPVDTEH